MAAFGVSCGAAASYRLFLGGRVSFARGQGLWKAAAAKLQRSLGCQILRLRHTTVVTTRKNVTALRRETYTVDFIKKQIEEFNIGKRHLANMMGEDPETFTQEDIDRAIAYLFPSGLFEKRARPVMKHPEEIFPKQRAIQWGEDGRPFHFLFYTGKQSYYSLMHGAYGKLLDVENRQDQLRAKGLFSEKTKAKDPIGSRWLIKEELEEMLVEKLSDQDYAQFIRLLERLSALPCDEAEEEFVGRFRRSVTIQSKKQLIEPVQYDEKGMAFSTGRGNRKTAKAEVAVYDHGSGKIEVNGVDYLLYFPVTQDRACFTPVGTASLVKQYCDRLQLTLPSELLLCPSTPPGLAPLVCGPGVITSTSQRHCVTITFTWGSRKLRCQTKRANAVFSIHQLF
ncbi:28S ribosomal protein S9, mitochondrial isoform X3 [Balaenoptera acutorostrata]|uniref:28S ribosomal protein S9, mitochondrial isoform X3 n=1 Tax=Balaenoptera acutorostrata TaxID=9767 RepID=A0A383ZAH9_BALAC|nr:28S ribosomal protein S9, mitochondrial isoform X3 [Balaenoptera acutorostrata]